MKLQMFQVDAFTDQVFRGNPAAVVPLETWLDDELLQAIADENNLSETAFFVKQQTGYELRWFTPAAEVDLCGHATLAAAHVIFSHLSGHLSGSLSGSMPLHTAANHEPYQNADGRQTASLRACIAFQTRSGELVVSRTEHGYTMNFPATTVRRSAASSALTKGLGGVPVEVLAGFDYVAVFDSEDQINALTPDFAELKTLDLRGVVATAPGTDVDFVSRCFFPKLRVDEDPVTGSAHCELAPYWANKLQKNSLTASQLSKRGGRIGCVVEGERVFLTGSAVDYMRAEIYLP